MNVIVSTLIGEIRDRTLELAGGRGIGRWLDGRRQLRDLRGPAPTVRCGLRTRGESLSDAGDSWCLGNAVLVPGRLSFTGHSEGAQTLRYEIHALRDLHFRDKPSGGSPAQARWALVTSDGELEWSVDKRLVDAAVAAVRPASPTA